MKATIDQVLADPAASRWLTAALKAALDRDMVDAANDADVLASLLDERVHMMERRIGRPSPSRNQG